MQGTSGRVVELRSRGPYHRLATVRIADVLTITIGELLLLLHQAEMSEALPPEPSIPPPPPAPRRTMPLDPPESESESLEDELIAFI